MLNEKPKLGIVEQAKAAKTLREREAILAKAKSWTRIHPSTVRKIERLCNAMR